MKKLLGELADVLGGMVVGDADVAVSGVADIHDAGEGDIVFAESDRHLSAAQKSGASAIIAYLGAPNSGKPMIRVKNPRFSFARVLEMFTPAKRRTEGIHPECEIDPTASIGDNPSIGRGVCIGQNSSIGKNVLIHPFVFIGDNVSIGDDCELYPMVCVYDRVVLGDRVVVHCGSVIGSDGFGYTPSEGRHYKIPHIGRVIVGDDVEIGANTTIDRGRTGDTAIGRGTKIDNLVQIAHNVTVGEDCVIAAQVGISGSVKVGDGAILTGQAGIKDHVSIGRGAIICGRGGVIGDISDGDFVSGYPARPHKDQMKIYAAEQRLPALLREVRELEKRIAELEGRKE